MPIQTRVRYTMTKHASASGWEKLGSIDPYFAVLNHDDYKGTSLSDDARAQFFESGEAFIAAVMADVRAHLDSNFASSRGLDFGCGVGRLTIPLARLCREIVGVDISASMLAEARANASRLGISNMTLRQSVLDASEPNERFDFVHSHIVFQHIAPKRGEAILRTMLEHLEPGGVGVLHFTYHRRATAARRVVHWARKTLPLANSLVNLMQRRPVTYPLMPMNEYDMNRILLMLQEAGSERSFLRFTDHGGHLGVVLYFILSA
jgi:SAM-dependent methyltransferase